jgi:hypothetical protein
MVMLFVKASGGNEQPQSKFPPLQINPTLQLKIPSVDKRKRGDYPRTTANVMTSAAAAAIATKSLKNGHPWRNRFPTITTTDVQKIFFGRSHRQHFIPKSQTEVRYADKADGVPFTAKLQPIQRLTRPAAPYTLGPNILRAFIYARQHYPDIPFRWASAHALQAVYESNRIDGFPRVMFTVSKEVEKLLIGKLHGLLRRRFKTRGRRAFIDALDQLRRERQGIFRLEVGTDE